jgi:hypothetical protein
MTLFHEVTKNTKVTKTFLEKTFFRDAMTSSYEEHEELFWKCVLRVLREPSCLREDVIPPWILSPFTGCVHMAESFAGRCRLSRCRRNH